MDRLKFVPDKLLFVKNCGVSSFSRVDLHGHEELVNFGLSTTDRM